MPPPAAEPARPSRPARLPVTPERSASFEEEKGPPPGGPTPIFGTLTPPGTTPGPPLERSRGPRPQRLLWPGRSRGGRASRLPPRHLPPRPLRQAVARRPRAGCRMGRRPSSTIMPSASEARRLPGRRGGLQDLHPEASEGSDGRQRAILARRDLFRPRQVHGGGQRLRGGLQAISERRQSVGRIC